MLTRLSTLTSATLLMAVVFTGCKTGRSYPAPHVNPEQVRARANSPTPPRKFDTAGNVVAAGAIVLDAANDDLAIITASY